MVPQRKLCLSAILACSLSFGISAVAQASDAACPGNPNALGVSRVITVTPEDYSRLGSMQYRQTLPLADHEVVLTFDDGPLPPYTSRVLTALAHECVHATFFMVGSMARAYPQMVRLVAELGHTIGNHSQNHPIHFDVIGEARAENEVENGIRSIKTALAGEGTLAPYFRVPGLGRTHAVENFLKSQNIVVWSSDTVADDWTPISSDQVLHRALRRLEAKGRGILLLHDIHARTATMLPALLRELKARGFHIVHVVPGKSPSDPPAEAAKVMMASASPEKLPIPQILANDAENVPAIEEKARQIASLGVTHSRSHSNSEPAARHIRRAKPGKPVQTAQALPERIEPSLLH
jgi:peptidoglycan/xylan/chitin deacetylase (PgdA/CDA1 family)